MSEIFIGSIAAGPLVAALVQLAKGLGLEPKYCPYLNAALSCIAYVAGLLLVSHPEYAGPTTIALNVIVTFLVAAGVYDVASNINKKTGTA